MTRAPVRRVSVVIVAREATPALLACIERVRRHTPSPAEVLVIDHGPADGFAHRLATLTDSDGRVPVRVLRAAEKVSFAAAANQGIRAARGRWVVLLGADTLVTPGWSAGLLTRTRDTRVGLVGPVTNGAAGGPQTIGATPAYDGPSALDAFAARWAGAHRGEFRRVTRLGGGCVLIRRAMLDRIGPLDERSARPVEELCERALGSGWSIVLSREVFVHRDAARVTRAATDVRRPRIALHFAPRPVAAASSGRPRLSLCVIARDEAKVLGRCLASARSAVDEIVVVDTGSTDDTREIARAHGAVVVDRPWDDDFSAARNAALDVARGDWILSLDADEELPARTAAQLRVTCTETSAPALRMPVETLGAGGAVDSVQCAVRLFTRTPGHRWIGTVHERVDSLHALDAPLPIRHHGWADPTARRAKLARDHALLERTAAAGSTDPALALHLAQARLALDDAPGAVRAAEDGLRRVAPEARSLGLLLLDTLAAARFAAGHQAGAEEACRTALALRPDWIDPRLLLGRLCRESGRLNEALGHFGRFLEDRARLLDDPTWPVRLPRLRALGAEAEARTELALVHATLHGAGRAARGGDGLQWGVRP